MKIGDLLYHRKYNSFGIITDIKDNRVGYMFYHWNDGISQSPKWSIITYWQDAQKMRSNLE